jgi:hypothetical protein
MRIHDILVWIRMDPDPDPAIFVSGDLQDLNKNFFFILLFEGTFTSFLKIKSHKKVTKQYEQCLSYYFCLMIEGSGLGSGSV